MPLRVNSPKIKMPKGGTEILYESLCSRIDLSNVNLMLSICDYNLLSDKKPNLLWQHLNYDQSGVKLLKDENYVKRLSGIVFVSHWQYEKFRQMFPIHLTKTFVIQNAIETINNKPKPEKIKLIYTSTPWRGLELLVEVLERIDRSNLDIEIYSGTSIYGEQFYNQNHQNFIPLYDRVKQLGAKHYEYATNQQIIFALQQSHILAYPNIFEETSCLSVIEALSSGCRVVSSSLGALPETCGTWANLLTLEDNYIEKYVEALEKEIEIFWSKETQTDLKNQVDYYKKYWCWNSRIEQWKKVIDEVQPITAETFLIKKSKENWIPNEHREYLRTVNKPKVVYDIGSSILHWRKTINQIWKNIDYYAFDVTPQLEDLYRKENIEYALTPLSDKEKIVDFYIDPYNPSGNSYYCENTKFYKDISPLKLKTTTLDKIVFENRYKLPDLIKIDVQGAELDVLKGADKVLDHCQDIIIELRHIEYNNGAPLAKIVIEFLESKNFKLISNFYDSKYDGDYHFSKK